jgi:hypothetical protein
MKFYNSFIELINKCINNKYEKKYYNKYFRNYLLKYYESNYINNESNNELITSMVNYLIHYINKPQRLLEDNDNYYVAIDLFTSIKYICFKDLCILDFDINKNNYTTKEEILNYINNNKILNEIVYYRVETPRGFHIYLMDKPRLYNNIETFHFLNNFESDIYYKFYCYMRGFSIRLSLKNNDTYIYNSIKLINKDKQKPNNRLNKLFYSHLLCFDKI